MRPNVRMYVHCLSCSVNTASDKLKSSGIVHILELFIQAGEGVHFALRPINLLA